MPKKGEFDELISNCTWTLATTNAVNGYIVKGKGNYAASSIFIPFTGYGTGTSLSSATSLGDYWSSGCYSGSTGYEETAWSLFIDSNNHNTSVNRTYINGRQSGLAIRPVMSVTE